MCLRPLPRYASCRVTSWTPSSARSPCTTSTSGIVPARRGARHRDRLTARAADRQDRALDGVHTYPIDTPFEFRSLPPTALRPENDVHQFLTAADVRVRAAITPPGSDAGDGIRFTLQQPETGLRDLVVSGRLQRIQIVEAP